jgi:A/G-specific adenine glycosylase
VPDMTFIPRMFSYDIHNFLRKMIKEELNIYCKEENKLISQYKRKGLTTDVIKLFQKLIYDFYRNYARDLPWRKTDNPYHILVSEIMLQQTQVERVREKYDQFIRTFPDFFSVSKAPLRDILQVWQGLGYNRRALALKKIADMVISHFNGHLPRTYDELITLPGLGRATASAIISFAYNRPTIFIETNIRTLFIHFFFQDENNVQDKDIIPLIEKTLDKSNPRKWYYALMDYGAYLKKRARDLNKKSAHYQKQNSFGGSNRQIRGMIIRTLLNDGNMKENKIITKINLNPSRIKENLTHLEKEGLIKKERVTYTIA